MRSSVFVALFVLGFAGRAAAANYFVAPTGDDSAAGTSAAPWKTLQKAAGRVAAGDVVTAADGTYAGFKCSGKSGTAAARIVFKAANKGGAKITSAGVGADAQDWVQLNSCSYVTVDGFEVSGAPRSGIAILGNSDDGSDARDVIIQNNHSHHNGGPVAHGRHDGIFSGFAMNLTIQDNESDNNSEHGIYVSNAADNPIIRRNHAHDVGLNCIQINADLSTGGDGLITGWLIEGNVAHGCGSNGFNLDGAVRGTLQNNLVYDARGGITLFQGDGAEASHDNVVVNNTIFNPTGTRAALQVASGANNNVVFNNILISMAAALEIQTVTGLVHDYNFVSSYDGGTASAHEAKPDPAALFTDVAARKLGLAAASPAKDAGVATLGGKQAPAADLEGKARPGGGGFDRGAFEGAQTGGGPAAPATGAAGSGGGAAGMGGAAGTNGAAGRSGAAGAPGSTGAAGATNGMAGATGAAGTSGGAAGISGGAAGAPPMAGAGGAPTTGQAGAAPPPSTTGSAGAPVTGAAGSPMTGAAGNGAPGVTGSSGGCDAAGGIASTWSIALMGAALARARRRRPRR